MERLVDKSGRSGMVAGTGSSDGRIPVLLAGREAAGADDAVLLEGDGALPPGAAARFSAASGSHAIGCACCVPRSDAARALARLFLARARGEVAFRRVVAVTASPAGRAAVTAAVTGDVLASARFALASPPWSDRGSKEG